jgi:hypothetical protein
MEIPLPECWEREKRFKMAVIFSYGCLFNNFSLFSDDIWISFRLEDISFCTKNKKIILHNTSNAPYTLISSTWANILCSQSVWSTKTRGNGCLQSLDHSSYFYMRGSKPSFFLPYLKGIPLNLWVRRKRWAINLPQAAFDSFFICICISINFKSERQ